MLVRTLGATVVATALVLLPTAAHAAGPVLPASSTVVSAEAPGAAVHAAADPAATAIPDDALMVGLVVLVGGAMLLALTGRRPDDDEPAD